MRPFVVFTLPRSRSFWLSRFLTYRDWTCAHDQIAFIRGMDDVRSWLSQDYTGAVDTGAASFWRIAMEVRPDLKVAVVRRHPDEVIHSILRSGLPVDPRILSRNIRLLDRKLDQIERNVPGALCVDYDELRNEETCARVFEFCLERPHDPSWWHALATINMQINFPAMVRYEAANKPQLERVKEMMKREVLRIAFKHHKAPDIEGFTFQEEPFDTFFAEGEHLFREHCMLVGEAPDEYLRKNIPVMRLLDQQGALQLLTARSNGKMFGYLASVLSPDMEHDDPNRHVALQTSWYASPHARGLGMSLQRESFQRLEQRGGRWRVVQRAGARGDGPRMGVIFKRLGAQLDGQMWSLEVGA